MPDAIDRQIVQRLSMSRLTGYLRASSNDISLAQRLYEWNTQMSAAFFELLSDVEVVVRNSFHEQLTVWHGVQNVTDQWYDNRHGFLQPRATAAIQEARTRIANKGKSATSDQIISELGFGFWRFLLTKPYKTTLWPFAEQYAFPNVSSTDQFFSRIARLHDFRNRIALTSQYTCVNLTWTYLTAFKRWALFVETPSHGCESAPEWNLYFCYASPLLESDAAK